MKQLLPLRESFNIVLMIDNEKQIALVENLATEQQSYSTRPWDIFIKLDIGSGRAGLPVGSPQLESLVRRAEGSRAVSIYGFYAHAGHSYGCHNQREAESVLEEEVKGVLSAAQLLPEDRKLILSLGATPTAHVVRSLKATAPPNVTLELHAGIWKQFLVQLFLNQKPSNPSGALFREFSRKRSPAGRHGRCHTRAAGSPGLRRGLQRVPRAG